MNKQIIRDIAMTSRSDSAAVHTQKVTILRRLKAGLPTNTVIAGVDLGIWRLAARIEELRAVGWNIESWYRPNSKIAQYRLARPHKIKAA